MSAGYDKSAIVVLRRPPAEICREPVKEMIGDCLIWPGRISNEGYGVVNIKRIPTGAHRVIYELFKGKIPDGLHLDHLCRNRSCVNPDHLQPVTPRENILRGESSSASRARQTHCQRGHPLSGGNLHIKKHGNGFDRLCLTCYRAKCRRSNIKLYERRKTLRAGDDYAI